MQQSSRASRTFIDCTREFSLNFSSTRQRVGRLRQYQLESYHYGVNANTMPLFNSILVVVDSSQPKHPELERALKLAEQSDVKLHLVDVVKDVSFTVRMLSRDYAHLHELLVKEKREQLQKLIDVCQAHGIAASGEVLEGVSSQKTVQAAARVEADLIVRLTKGARSLEAGNLGTSAQKLIRGLPCAMWLADAEHEPNCQTIVATVDASPEDDAHRRLNQCIMKIATALSARERGKLLVCYVWSLYGAEMLKHRMPTSEFEALLEFNRQQHRDSFERLLSEYDLHANGPSARMLEGEPSEAIPNLCDELGADLLICGTVARHGIPGLLLGNTAERIVNRVNCSILAVTPPI